MHIVVVANHHHTPFHLHSSSSFSSSLPPRCGIAEDPVTGSAHCSLAPYWALKLGKTSLVGYQASKRGGVVVVEVQGDRVKLKGKAVLVKQGYLCA